MNEFIPRLLLSGRFISHRHPRVLGMAGLQGISNELIALAYSSVLIALIWYACQRRLRFRWLLMGLALFAFASGLAQVCEIWPANDWLAQIFTTLAAVSFVPSAILLARGLSKEKQTAHDREFYTALVEKFPVPIWRSDVRGECDYFNQTWLDFTGRTMAQEIGQGWTESVHPSDLDGCLKTYREAFEARHSYEMEYRLRRHDGVYRWMLDYGRAFEREGQFAGYVGSCHDITERKQAEDDLRLFRTFVEQSNDTLEVIDPNSARFLEVNAKGPAELGYSRAEYLSLRVIDIDPTMDESTWPAVMEKIRLGGVFSGEGRHQRKDGTTFPIEFNAKWVHLDRDYIVTSIRDITERKIVEERLVFQAHLLDTVEQAVIATNLEGEVTYWNRFAEKLYGTTAAEALGRKIMTLTVPEISGQQGLEIMDRLRVGESWSGEFQVSRRDGTTFPAHVTNSSIRDSSGKIIGMMGISHDITERRLAEEALRTSEEHFTTFMNNLPGFAWMKDGLGRYVYLNQATLHLPEFAGQPLGKTDFDLRPVEIAQEYYANDQKVLATRMSLQTIEHYLLDGVQRAVLVSKFPVPNETGAIGLVGGVSFDISERIEAEESLRKSEARLAEAEALAHLGSWEWEIPTNSMTWSEEKYRLMGLDPQASEASYDRLLQSIHAEDRGRVHRTLQTALRDHQPASYSYRLVHADGSIRFHDTRISTTTDADGRPIRMIGTTLDVTERQQTGAALHQANEQLRILSRRLFEVQEEERRHLARELHDQIGQALTAAKINLQNAAKLHSPHEIVAQLDGGIAVLDELTETVRQLSLELRPPLLDDLGLVPALRWYLDRQAQLGGFHLEVFADPNLGRFSAAIETACFRIVQEAVTNILRHANAEKVKVEIRKPLETLRLIVRDDGVGFKAPVETSILGGKGLGILGMRERVAILDGKINFRTEVGHGVELEVLLPIRT